MLNRNALQGNVFCSFTFMSNNSVPPYFGEMGLSVKSYRCYGYKKEKYPMSFKWTQLY